MAFLGGLFGGNSVSVPQGVDINQDSFKIQDEKKYRTQAESQFQKAKDRTNYIQPKQRSLIESLELQAAGQGPSLATEQLKMAQNRNLAQQLAAAQAARGGGGLAQRQLLRSQQQSGAQIAESGAVARMQEQQQARALLAQQINQEQTTADELTKQYLQQGFNIAQAQQQALADLERLKVQQATELAQAQVAAQQANNESSVMGAKNLLGLGSSLLGGAISSGIFSKSASALPTGTAVSSNTGSGMLDQISRLNRTS